MLVYYADGVRVLLGSAAILCLMEAIHYWFTHQLMRKSKIAVYAIGMLVFGSAAAFGGPSGEAVMDFDDGQRTVLSVAITESGGMKYYNLVLAEDRVEDARYHKLSADMLTVIGIPKDANCRTFTVKSKQGLRTATLDCSVVFGG